MNELNLIEEGSSVPIYQDALHFDNDTYVDKVAIGLNYLTNTRTVSLWVKLDTATFNGQSRNFMFAQYNSSGQRTTYCEFRDTGVIRISIPTTTSGNSATVIESNAGVYFNANQWYYISITLTGTRAELYVDNVMQTQTVSTSLPFTRTGGTFTVGNFGSYLPAFGFKGTIRDVSVWNTTRTQSELLADETRIFTGSEPGLKGHWNFDEGSGTSVTDASGTQTKTITTTNPTSNYIDNFMWVREVIGNSGAGIKKSKIDLFEGQFVSVTKQSFDVNNLTQRLAGVTNNFTLPFTANNSEVFDYLDLNGTLSNKPYQINYVEYIQDGTPIIKKGRLNVKEVSDAGYKVDVTHGINDFFDRIRDSYLYNPFVTRQDQIDSMFAIKQVLSNDTSVQNTEGVVIPLVDYGFINPLPEYQQSPYLIIKKAFEFIAEDVDYTFIDSTDGKLNDLLLSPNKLYEDVGELKEIYSSNVLNGGDNILLSTFYTTKKGQIFREYNTTNSTISGSPVLEIKMFADSVLINSYTLPSNTTDYNVFQTFPTMYEIGTKIEIYISNTVVTSSFEIGDITIYQGSTFGVGANTNIFYENLFPITQVDFIKYVFEIFNLSMEVNPLNKTFELYNLNDVYNPNTGTIVDLSDYYSNVIYKKFDGDFGKVNHFKYQYKDGNEPTYDSSITANNINKEKDLITSNLTGCFFDRSLPLGSAYPYLLSANGYDSADFDASSKEIGYRIVKQIPITTNPTVVYQNRNQPAGTFNQVGNQTVLSFDGLDWSSLIEDNYSSLRDYVLNRYQEVKLLMRVPKHLIDTFSFKNKIYISQLNSNFVVQSIKTRPDGLSEWIIIKLN